MNRRHRAPSEVLRHLLENAALLTFASLMAMSVFSGRFSGALLWSGALTVFFVHACETRLQPLDVVDRMPRQALRSQRYDVLRWVGLALAFAGAALTF
jgi:hypothetical protein